jgi:pyridoxal biosynthesis lyase PdxS
VEDRGRHAHRHGARAVGAGCRAPSEPVRSFSGAPLWGFGVEALGRVRKGAAIIRAKREAGVVELCGTVAPSGGTDVSALRGMDDDEVFAHAKSIAAPWTSRLRPADERWLPTLTQGVGLYVWTGDLRNLDLFSMITTIPQLHLFSPTGIVRGGLLRQI